MLPQNTQNQTDTISQLANPFQLEVAKSLSKEMAVLQKNQLLTADILAKTPHAKERTDFIIKTFALVASQQIR